MQIKDYRRLGKISIKSRKKSTRHTVTGICFGLIMLIPIVYFTLSFYIGLTDQLDKTATTSVFVVNARNVYDDAPAVVDDSEWGGGMALFEYKTGERLAGDPMVEEYSVAEYYRMAGAENGFDGGKDSRSPVLSLTADNKPYSYKGPPSQPYGRQMSLDTFKIVNNYVSDRIFLEAEERDLNARGEKLFAYGGGFTDDGKSQVLVSRQFLSACGVAEADMEQLIGKKISLSSAVPKQRYVNGGIMYLLDSGDSISKDLADQKAELDWLSDFTLAGVLSDAYYKLPSNESEAHVVVTAPSVYTENYAAVAPSFNVNFLEREQGYTELRLVVKYTGGISAMCARAAGEGRAALAVGALVPMKSSNGYMTELFNQMTEKGTVTEAPAFFKMQCRNYMSASKFTKTLNAAYAGIIPSTGRNPIGAVDIYANDVYENFFLLGTIGKYVMLILYSFGGIIFFATMLNLYNSVNYSVQARRNYMGVMRAIGAKQKMIPRLYFFEILLIFARALPWVLVFSAGVSYGIKAGIDAMFKYIGTTLGGIVRLPFSWYFVTLAGVVVIVFAIALAFSRIACKNVAGKPILDVLSDDKG